MNLNELKLVRIHHWLSKLQNFMNLMTGNQSYYVLFVFVKDSLIFTEGFKVWKWPLLQISNGKLQWAPLQLFLQTSSTYFVGEVKNTCVWTRNRNRWEIGESINHVVNKSSWDRINWFNNAAEGHCVYQITGNARKSRAYRIVLVVTLLDAIFVIHELTMALSVQQISLAGQIGTFAIR